MIGTGGRPRPVPGTFAETVFPRWFWWAAVVANGLFAAVWTVAAFMDGWPWASARWVFAGLALGWWALVGAVSVLILVRPRHTAQDLQHATVEARDRPGSPAADGGILVPGSARITTAAAAFALTWAVSFGTFAAVAESGWRAWWIGCAVVALAGATSEALAIRPRWLLLTPQGLTVSGFVGESSVGWDDIEEVTFVQGRDGLMVHKIHATPGVEIEVKNRHPLVRRRTRSVDIENATLDLDPLLVMLAILTYQQFPWRREELTGPAPPERLTDPGAALGPGGASDHLRGFRPERR